METSVNLGENIGNDLVILTDESGRKSPPQIFPIDDFNPTAIAPGKVTCIVAKRGSGKSTLIRNLLYQLRKAPLCLAFSATEQYNNFYGDIIDESMIHEDYDSDIIKTLIQRQKIIINKTLASNPFETHAVLVLDDTIADANKIFNDRQMKFLFFNGRALKINLIIAAQCIMSIPPNYRVNIDYVFLFKETNLTVQKKLYEFFGASIFPRFEDFKASMDHYTTDYGCMVINNTSVDADYRKRVFKYKARVDLPDFKMSK